jgi:hypothetical protein
VQRIRKKVGNRWGLLKQPIDLMNKPNAIIKKQLGPCYHSVIKPI